MRVVMLASEAQPWAKTGGLGDVLGALPAALAEDGLRVTVVLPAYREALIRAGGAVRRIGRVWAPISSRTEPLDVLAVTAAAVPTVLLASTRYYDRPGLYGTRLGDYPDNAERFVALCRAALEWLRTCAEPPHVLHTHDWQTALAPAFLRAAPELYPELRYVRCVHTIHNLAYQGRFWAADWHLLNLDRQWFTPEWLEFWGHINFLKAGLVFADAITTVSPRYAREIQTPEYGQGLDGVLRARADRLHGITNGIDVRRWNPATDPSLPERYDVDRLQGKHRCKVALQRELGLSPAPEPPLLAVLSRLVEQKGIDVVLAAAPILLASRDVQLAILGTGVVELERALRALAAAWPRRVAVRIGFDEELAHRIVGGADALLMPSRYEPCGLAQMHAMRYGTVPIVHAVGGLDDTVQEWDEGQGRGTGFKFAPATSTALLEAIDRALAVRARPAAWRQLQRNGMLADFSWARAARAYRTLYASLLAAPRPPSPP